ncbi:MAG: outer membrane protein assembly factor BamE [Proteobacteria bacterium]|nr:MAG: outer membrane protein assembly factor BamE [Pseudomonadota bacterium]
MRQLKILTACLIGLALLAGCVRVYKIDVQQGNDLSERQMEKLEVGMSRQDVRALLGTPLVDDPFRKNRWDYFYQLQKGRSKEIVRRQVSLFFDDDRLSRIEGGLDGEVLPAKPLDLEKMDEQMKEQVADDTPEADQPGFWDRVSAVLRRSEDE